MIILAESGGRSTVHDLSGSTVMVWGSGPNLTPPPHNKMTETYENITFPRTTYAVGNNECNLIDIIVSENITDNGTTYKVFLVLGDVFNGRWKRVFGIQICGNKIVLLHECKRHTTHRIASTCYTALSVG